MGKTKNSYEEMNAIDIPDYIKPPIRRFYINTCL